MEDQPEHRKTVNTYGGGRYWALLCVGLELTRCIAWIIILVLGS